MDANKKNLYTYIHTYIHTYRKKERAREEVGCRDMCSANKNFNPLRACVGAAWLALAPPRHLGHGPDWRSHPGLSPRVTQVWKKCFKEKGLALSELQGVPLNIVYFSPRIFNILRPLPRQNLAAIGCTENGPANKSDCTMRSKIRWVALLHAVEGLQ